VLVFNAGDQGGNLGRIALAYQRFPKTRHFREEGTRHLLCLPLRQQLFGGIGIFLHEEKADQQAKGRQTSDSRSHIRSAHIDGGVLIICQSSR
jgi:hypothetical protein